MTETKITPVELEVIPGKRLSFAWPEAYADEPVTADHRDFLKKIEADILAINPALDPNTADFQITVLVIAARTLVGPFLHRLVELTGFPPMLVYKVCHNLRSAGLWDGCSVDCGGLDELGYRHASLWCHVAVAAGLFTAEWNDERCQWVYHAVPAA